MEEVEILLSRNTYTTRATLGGLYFPEDNYKERFCYTLEDTVRGEGIKVHGETALPGSCEGVVYDVELRYSPSFKRECPVLFTRKTIEKGVTKYYAEHKDVSFLYAMLHGGNDIGDSFGCPLVCYNKIKDDLIQGTAEKELTAKIKAYLDAGKKVKIRIVNNPQSN